MTPRKGSQNGSSGRTTAPKEREAPEAPATVEAVAAPSVASQQPKPGDNIPMNEAKTIVFLREQIGGDAVEKAAYRAALDDALQRNQELAQMVDTLNARVIELTTAQKTTEETADAT